MLIQLQPNNPPPPSKITGLKAKTLHNFIWNLPYTDTTMTSKQDRKCMANKSIDRRVALRLNSWQSGALGKLCGLVRPEWGTKRLWITVIWPAEPLIPMWSEARRYRLCRRKEVSHFAWASGKNACMTVTQRYLITHLIITLLLWRWLFWNAGKQL